MQTIVVENTQPRIIGFPPTHQLVPGENDVPLAEWERFAASKVGQMLTREGHLKEHRDRKRATPLVHKLSVNEEGKAIGLVQRCMSQKLLRIWAAEDGRSRVQKAIARRMDELGMPEPVTEAESKGKAASKG